MNHVQPQKLPLDVQAFETMRGENYVLDFEDYWFENATPTFLTHLFKESHDPLPAIEGMKISRMIFNQNGMKPIFIPSSIS